MTRVLPFVRPAASQDVPQAVQTLAAAFADYPWTRHTVAADRHVWRIERLQELFLTRFGLPYGRVWVTGDVRAVAVWTTPDTAPPASLGEELDPLVAELTGDRADVSARAEALMAPHRPAGPAWTLQTVAVHPEAQGRGLGSAVLRPGLEAAAQAGLPAYLETSSERNVRFYERLGFAVTARVTLPEGGPLTWSMVRAPSGPH
ncbi:N-acetyltransferase [Deinococcus irradiatisoli]|uniref:N-acetyltransferase n=1 Tax=Deinococcus irradiatisoli TaxID=2202254 RepID=A0A2Z3JMQ4_9DEIO|nr:GNAT family N-acetyltransferase [Deinococcus irradiatisoli]AWN22494.1 N-acetyltransferase [Deinococcus irradiatisoli]